MHKRMEQNNLKHRNLEQIIMLTKTNSHTVRATFIVLVVSGYASVIT